MQEQDGLNAGQRELERALRSLASPAARVDPIAAAFAAGVRSSERKVRLWRSAAALSLLITAGSWMLPVRHNAGPLLHQDFPGQTIVLRHSQSPLPEQSLLMLQEAMREKGPEGLPVTQLPPVQNGPAGNVF